MIEILLAKKRKIEQNLGSRPVFSRGKIELLEELIRELKCKHKSELGSEQQNKNQS